MDKSRKLRRYTRKDYSEVVDFPVEIVGRDGVVRRYSFEESVRLYQRRIASAGSRHADLELADAEMEHCRRRIAQLRQSYFERYGAEALRIFEATGRPGLAGEVAAFLRRTLGAAAGPGELLVEVAGEIPQGQAYGVRLGEGPGLLLYVYVFDGPLVEGVDADPPGPARDAFRDQVQDLQALRELPEGVERLVAAHHGPDLGLVLTAAAEVAGALPAGDPPELEEPGWGFGDPEGDDEGAGPIERLRRGDLDGALAGFTRAFEADPWRRGACMGGLVLADQLGRHEEAAMLARLGSHHFPGDAAVTWHLALAQLRLGQLDGAREALARAQALQAPAPAVTLLRAVLALAEGRMRAGRRLLVELARAPVPADDPLLPARRLLRAALALHAVGRATALLLAFVGARLVAGGWPWGALGIALGAAGFLASGPLWRRWFRRRLAAPGAAGLPLAAAIAAPPPA